MDEGVTDDGMLGKNVIYSAVQYSRELHYHNWFNAKPGPIAAPSMPHAYKVRYKDKKKYSSAYSSRVLPK
jgi:hypothetical protein